MYLFKLYVSVLYIYASIEYILDSGQWTLLFFFLVQKLKIIFKTLYLLG